MSSEMQKAWRPQDVEPAMYRDWEEAGLFVADPADPRPHFSVVLPPPNVTGELHLGHAVMGALQDTYCRYKRMRGFEVLWLPGTDHAAIATQNVIERQLAEEGTTKEQVGRAAFDRRVTDWYAEYGARIVDQFKRLGVSLDWTRLRFTMDPAYVHAVRAAFVQLYEEGLIYRGPRIVNWCPRCHSSISDLEVDWQEQEDVLYHVRYDMADGDGALVVATVRPETMLADTAVAVNPGDPRYTAFIGRTALLPLVGRELPVIADDYVKTDFGTGALKVTPGHDPNDYEIGRRHHLEVISCIDKDGNIESFDWIPDELRTRDALTARGRVVEMLRDRDHLVRTESYVHEVGHCDRCGSIIEPLVDEQWWCSMETLAQPAIEVVESGKLRFVPTRWNDVYLRWMRNLRDWNVGRQLWLGHRIPVYYCDLEHRPGDGPYVFASVDEPTACPLCGSTAIRQDPDVLDTWFSSALWPFATMGWPDSTPDLEAFHPTDILGTARDIIFLWVARMIMTDLHFNGVIPFHTVVINATIQSPEGARMSKSKGNGVDPLEMIDRYGADAVRAWAAEVAVGRQDVRFDEARIEAYQRFANKTWNVAKFVLGATEGASITTSPAAPGAGADLFDRWISSRLNDLVDRVTDALESYQPGDAIGALYEFTWHEFADWYLEAIKPRLRGQDAADRDAAATTARYVLETVVRLLHPFMPFLSEAIWQRLPGETESAVGRPPLIARADSPSWPSPDGGRDEKLEADMDALIEVIRGVREAAREVGVGAREAALAYPRRAAPDPSSDLVDSAAGRSALALLTPLAMVDTVPAGGRTVVLRGLEMQVAAPASTGPSAADGAALERQRQQARAEVDRLNNQLGNQQFVSRARPEVVDDARRRLDSARERLAVLEAAG